MCLLLLTPIVSSKTTKINRFNSIFVTTAALLCKHINVLRYVTVKMSKLKLYKPPFIVYPKAYTVVQKQNTSITKVGMAHAY